MSSKTSMPPSSSKVQEDNKEWDLSKMTQQYNNYATKENDEFPAGSISNPEDGVVAMLEDFFYFEDPLTERVENWAKNQPLEILKSFALDEHTLEHTSLHNEYKQLFEGILTEYLEQQGFSVQEFYLAAAKEEETMKGKRRKGDTFSAILLAASDFDEFCDMMNMVRQGHGVAFCPPLVEWSEGDDDQEEEHNDDSRSNSSNSSNNNDDEGSKSNGKTKRK
jgi:hypothetical protein